VEGPADCTGNRIPREETYDLTLITYKAITQTKSRTSGNYWLKAVYPENAIEISAVDAQRLGLREGGKVRVVSSSNPKGVWDLGHGRILDMIGKVHVIQGIRPGVAAFSLGNGHWAYGSSPVTIDGVTYQSDSRRATGIHANAAMQVDPVLRNTGLVDTVGGSAVFYQSRVKLIPV